VNDPILTRSRHLLLGGLLLAPVMMPAQTPAQTPSAQTPPAKRPPTPRGPLSTPPTKAEPVEALGGGLFRVGTIRVNTAKRELSVAGTINDTPALEFIANTKGGWKAYESAIELDTNAITFNVALLLIGMDPANSVPPKAHFDPATPKGDPVEIWVEWTANGKPRRVPAEELVFNLETKRTLPPGPWVYTGSVINDRTGGFLADIEGSLISFVHTPAPIIEHPAPVQRNYGSNRFNTSLGLSPGDTVTLTVRAVSIPK
jgi:hypothetical protein